MQSGRSTWPVALLAVVRHRSPNRGQGPGRSLAAGSVAASMGGSAGLVRRGAAAVPAAVWSIGWVRAACSLSTPDRHAVRRCSAPGHRAAHYRWTVATARSLQQDQARPFPAAAAIASVHPVKAHLTAPSSCFPQHSPRILRHPSQKRLSRSVLRRYAATEPLDTGTYARLLLIIVILGDAPVVLSQAITASSCLPRYVRNFRSNKTNIFKAAANFREGS